MTSDKFAPATVEVQCRMSREAERQSVKCAAQKEDQKHGGSVMVHNKHL